MLAIIIGASFETNIITKLLFVAGKQFLLFAIKRKHGVEKLKKVLAPIGDKNHETDYSDNSENYGYDDSGNEAQYGGDSSDNDPWSLEMVENRFNNTHVDCYALFIRLDNNPKDGFWNRSEVDELYIQYTDRKLNDGEWNWILNTVDFNKDGQLDINGRIISAVKQISK